MKMPETPTMAEIVVKILVFLALSAVGGYYKHSIMHALSVCAGII